MGNERRLSPFAYLEALQPQTEDLRSYFGQLIDQSSTLLQLSLDESEKAILLDLMLQLVRENDTVRPLQRGEAMVDLFVAAQSFEEHEPVRAAHAYKQAGDMGLLASGGIGYLPRAMRESASEKTRKMEANIRKFLNNQIGKEKHEQDPRFYYQAMAQRAYRQAAQLGHEMKPTVPSLGVLITDSAEIKRLSRDLMDPRRTEQKKKLIERLAEKVPELSDAILFMKALSINRDPVLAHQMVLSRSAAHGILNQSFD